MQGRRAEELTKGAEDIERGSLVAAPLADTRLPRPLYLITWKNRQHSPICGTFCEFSQQTPD